MLQWSACRIDFDRPHAEDNFMCNKCNARRIEPPDIDKTMQHYYTHHMVRCKAKHVVDEKITTEERISTLETKVSRLEDYLVRIESSLSSVLEKMDGGKRLIEP